MCMVSVVLVISWLRKGASAFRQKFVTYVGFVSTFDWDLIAFFVLTGCSTLVSNTLGLPYICFVVLWYGPRSILIPSQGCSGLFPRGLCSIIRDSLLYYHGLSGRFSGTLWSILIPSQGCSQVFSSFSFWSFLISRLFSCVFRLDH